MVYKFLEAEIPYDKHEKEIFVYYTTIINKNIDVILYSNVCYR